MTQTERQSKQFKEVSTCQISMVSSLNEEERKALVRFLRPSSPRDIRAIINQANKLPDKCKSVLEGHLFHEGLIKLSLLYAIADLPSSLLKLGSDLGLDN